MEQQDSWVAGELMTDASCSLPGEAGGANRNQAQGGGAVRLLEGSPGPVSNLLHQPATDVVLPQTMRGNNLQAP